MTDQNKLTKFWNELKRRKVVRVTIIYASSAFILLQLISLLENDTGILPDWVPTFFWILLFVGLPIVVILAWIFDVTSKGIQKTESLEQESLPDKKSLDNLKPNPPDKSIIVLPFENISSDPEQEYFSDGLTEEIITDLSHVHDLLVISRSSAMTFKGSKQTLKKIAQKVNVRYVLAGSVRKSGNNLRITAQLIDATNDTHLWAKKYNERLESIFEIQENVSRSIVDALKLRLTPEEDKNLAEHQIDNIDANDFYLKARYEILSFSVDGLNRALVSIQNALDLEGENSRLLGLKGYAYFQYVNMGIKQEEYIKLAAEFANKALELDPNSADANFTLGLIAMLQGNIQRSIIQLKKALTVTPNDSDILIWCAWFYMLAGKPLVAIPLAKRALKSDPLNDSISWIFGPIACFEGRFEKALEHTTKAYKIQPENSMSVFWYILCLAYDRKTEEVIYLFEKSYSNPTEDIMIQLAQFLKFAIKGELDEIKLLLSNEFISTSKRDSQLSYHIATFYCILNQPEPAMEWMENAVNRGFINYPFMNEIDPFLENIRNEPRFKKLMKKVKKEWENFEV